MALCHIETMFALEFDAFQYRRKSIQVKLIQGLEALVEVLRQRLSMPTNEVEQSIVPFHLDDRAILRQQREHRARFEANGGFLDLALRVTRIGFHFYS